MSGQTRTVIMVATCVLALHVAALWALQLGLTARKAEVVVPVQLLARIVEPPQPIATAPQTVVAPEPAAPKPAPTVRKLRTPKPSAVPIENRPTPPKPVTTTPAPEPAPMPAVAEPAAAPIVPTATATAAAGKPAANRHAGEPAPASAATVVAAAAPAASSVRPVPPAVELPSSDAQYLQNPRPRYPPISLRLREQGTVLVDVLVSEQGLAKEARVQTSSGFFRLDRVAVSTVLTWRFVPGKRGGIAQSMWFTVPIEFAIQ